MDRTAVKIYAMASVPRLGFTDHFHAVLTALYPVGLRLHLLQGVYWQQELEKHLEHCQKMRIDWALVLDYDSLFTVDHVRRLLSAFADNPDIDALAALQVYRHGGRMLASGHGLEAPDDGILRVETAHFGLTLLRVAALSAVAKPWLQAQPDANGGWGPGHKDADIMFWHAWRAAGNTAAIDTFCRIGHLELSVLAVSAEGDIITTTPHAWADQCQLSALRSPELSETVAKKSSPSIA